MLNQDARGYTGTTYLMNDMRNFRFSWQIRFAAHVDRMSEHYFLEKAVKCKPRGKLL